jgi:phosphatidylserine decarboxylase
MKISKEGRVIIPVLGLVLAALAVGFIFLTRWALGPNITAHLSVLCCNPITVFWSLAALVTWGFVIAFFRVPSRPLLSDDGAIYAPCDGKVVVCEDVDETEVSGERRIQVSIFMSITNVHVNWFPVSGRITYFKHHNGRFMVAWHPKSSDDNERTTTAVETPRGTVVFRQVAGFVARRIISYAKVGENAAQNTHCGFIKFGSRVDLYLPLDAEVLVTLGQKVCGSQTPIARFSEK